MRRARGAYPRGAGELERGLDDSGPGQAPVPRQSASRPAGTPGPRKRRCRPGSGRSRSQREPEVVELRHRRVGDARNGDEEVEEARPPASLEQIAWPPPASPVITVSATQEASEAATAASAAEPPSSRTAIPASAVAGWPAASPWAAQSTFGSLRTRDGAHQGSQAEDRRQARQERCRHGLAPVQIALLSRRIDELTEHLRTHRKDHHRGAGCSSWSAAPAAPELPAEARTWRATARLIKELGLRRRSKKPETPVEV